MDDIVTQKLKPGERRLISLTGVDIEALRNSNWYLDEAVRKAEKEVLPEGHNAQVINLFIEVQSLGEPTLNLFMIAAQLEHEAVSKVLDPRTVEAVKESSRNPYEHITGQGQEHSCIPGKDV
ncbi:MAG TPA: hypothetical protein VEK36_00810 [Candidatus Paceibacterota bacterium]|nr:hypothetical protein [Candidatus Paceibacterota bacterium]